MIEDALRETFAARAADRPGDRGMIGLADVAMRRAQQIHRRRVMMSGLAGIVVFAMAGIVTIQILASGAQQRTVTVAVRDLSPAPLQHRPSAASVPPPPAEAPMTIQSGEVQPSKNIKVNLPDKGTIMSAYRANDGYLLINGEADGGKQLLLVDDSSKQRVLVDEATNIAISGDGTQVAWAQPGTMSVAKRTADNPLLSKRNTVKAPPSVSPVAFVGTDVVLGREQGAGFDVWYTERDSYTESWDPTVVRVFGSRSDGKGLYAQVVNGDDEPMCLAELALDQPFKLLQRVCGLPIAAKLGGGISPDGRWLAYPVDGMKQVAMIDLNDIFSKTPVKSKVWDIATKGQSVWRDAVTFVVDNGTSFVAINPTQTGRSETYKGTSVGAVLIEQLGS